MSPASSPMVKLEADSGNNRLQVIVSVEVPADLPDAEKQRIREVLYLDATRALDKITDFLEEFDG